MHGSIATNKQNSENICKADTIIYVYVGLILKWSKIRDQQNTSDPEQDNRNKIFVKKNKTCGICYFFHWVLLHQLLGSLTQHASIPGHL